MKSRSLAIATVRARLIGWRNAKLYSLRVPLSGASARRLSRS
ncbi:MAG TPA: hypothetical protein VHT00_06170 [Stellaceae bacterium]|nr:hypothetical protein [Stellaceae bacterium]HEX3418758.1 hypothetical protein [Stellaceae bacterium]